MRPKRYLFALALALAVQAAAAPMFAAESPNVQAILDALPNEPQADQVRDINKLGRLFVDKTIDPNDPVVITALGRFLLAKDSEPANEAAFSLMWAGIDALGPAREGLKSQDKNTQSRAALLIGGLARKFTREGTMPQVRQRFAAAVPELAACLADHPLGSFKTNAIAAYIAIGTPAKKELLSLLNLSADDTAATGAIDGLASLGQEVLPELLDALRADSAVVRRRAAAAIGRIPSLPPQPIGSLANLLSDPDRNVRIAAADALRRAGAAAHGAADALIANLQKSPDDLSACLGALLAVHAEPRHLPALLAVAAAKGQNDRSFHDVARAVATIEPPPVNDLAKALDDPRPGVPQVALYALSTLGTAAKPALPALLLALDKPALFHETLPAVSALGPDAKDAIPKIIPHLADARWDSMASIHRRLSAPAAVTLSRIGEPSIPPLLDALNDKNQMVQCSAVYALALIAMDHPDSCLPALRKFVESEGPPDPRVLALTFLAQLDAWLPRVKAAATSPTQPATTTSPVPLPRPSLVPLIPG